MECAPGVGPIKLPFFPGRGIPFFELVGAALALDHPLARSAGPVQLRALKNQTFLTLGTKHRLSHIVAGLAARAGGRVSDEYEGTSLDAIRLMAASGAGVAVLPSIYAATEARRGTDVSLRVIEDPAAFREIALVQPLLPEPRPGSDLLVEILCSEAKRISE